VSNPPPTLLIVSGLPATGKTTLARRIAKDFGLPVVHKDEIKEHLCDALGFKGTDLAESRRIGTAAITLLYHFAEQVLRAGQNCVLESFFRPPWAFQDLQALQERCPYTPLQIHCHTSFELSRARYEQRHLSGVRHPGHMDTVHLSNTNLSDVQPELSQAIPIGGHVIELNTTDFEAIDYEELYAEVGELLSK
jgi:predicted kinase